MAEPGTASLFLGARLRRHRRALNLTQAAMAEALSVSPSYIALLERNQRPMTAEILVRLAKAFAIDIASFSEDDGRDLPKRVAEALADPLFSDVELMPGEAQDMATNHPGMAEAFVQLHTAHRETQQMLADQRNAPHPAAPLEEVRAFLTTRRNFFPVLDRRAEDIRAQSETRGGMAALLQERFGVSVRELPPHVMDGRLRRYEPHRHELRLSDQLDGAGRRFQKALQLAYLALKDEIDAALREGQFSSDNAFRIARRALANYAAGAILMPYGAFYAEAETRAYDVEALARAFRVSFEQAAHRLTTLQRPGAQGVPFFFIRVDAAGNVSKRLDGGEFPFARRGGSCSLWSLHHVFGRPRQVVTEILELPEGERFFSVVRTVTSGGGAFGAPRVERAIALCCSIEHANRLIYTRSDDASRIATTPIGVACQLCQRSDCAARAEPPIGRQLRPDDIERMSAPFEFGEG